MKAPALPTLGPPDSDFQRVASKPARRAPSALALVRSAGASHARPREANCLHFVLY